MPNKKVKKYVEISIYECDKCQKEFLNSKQVVYHKEKYYCKPCFNFIRNKNNNKINSNNFKDDYKSALQYSSSLIIEPINKKYISNKTKLEILFEDFKTSVKQLSQIHLSHARYFKIIETLIETMKDIEKINIMMQEKINNSYKKLSVSRIDGTIDNYYLSNAQNEYYKLVEKNVKTQIQRK